MNTVRLRYGVLTILVESYLPITIPLPLENYNFPMWISPLQIRLRLYPIDPSLPIHNAKDVPEVLNEFYTAMDTLHIDCLPPYRHCNSWWKENGTLCAYFPYETDNFLMKIVPNDLLISIWGNEYNLNRVILDILACFAAIPPLHGAAVKKDERTIVLLGESGSGKTRVLKSLIDKGYTYIADEEIFWDGNQIFCCGRVIAGKKGASSFFPARHTSAGTLHSVTDVFFLTGDACNEQRPVLLPIIARQSFWAQVLIGTKQAPKMIERLMVANSKYTYLLNKARKIRVCQSAIHDSITEIEEFLQ